MSQVPGFTRMINHKCLSSCNLPASPAMSHTAPRHQRTMSYPPDLEYGTYSTQPQSLNRNETVNQSSTLNLTAKTFEGRICCLAWTLWSQRKPYPKFR